MAKRFSKAHGPNIKKEKKIYFITLGARQLKFFPCMQLNERYIALTKWLN